jgi:hypothetical protein
MEKRSLVSKKNAPASKSNPRSVDLSKPAPARVETCRNTGKNPLVYLRFQ